MLRIGFLSLSTPGVQNSAPTIQAFRESLRAQGYVEGQNIRIEYRFSEGNEERLVDVVNELARIPVAAIVAVGTPWAVAAKRADVRVPVVMVAVGDPVGAGLVESLARPGGHLTGPGSGGPALVAKKLELLKELVPDAGTLRVAVFANLSNPSKTHQLQAAQASARRLGVELLPVDVRTPEGIPSAFERALAAGARCVLVLSDALMVRNRTQITQLARQVRIPTMYEGADYAEAGGADVLRAKSVRDVPAGGRLRGEAPARCEAR